MQLDHAESAGGGAMDIRSTLTGLCEAFNAHDLDRIMTFFSDDAVSDLPAWVQAIGTIIAVGVAVLVPYRIHTNEQSAATREP